MAYFYEEITIPKRDSKGHWVTYTDKDGNRHVEEITANAWTEGVNPHKLFFVLQDYYENGNIQEKYFASFFIEKFEELGLDQIEAETFLNIIMEEICKKVGKEPDALGLYSITNSDLKAFCKNFDGTWFDEMIKLAEENFTSLNPVDISRDDIKATTTINSEVLFAEHENGLTAEYLMNNIDELALSSDPSVRKLSDLLNRASFKNLYEEILKQDDYAMSYISYEAFLNALIQTINQEYGIENTTPPMLTKEAIEKLNSDNLFEKLKELAKSDECYRNSIINGINGEIDEFCQGGTGDCWLLAGLKALAVTDEGKEIIKKQVVWAEDFSKVTVYFAGKDKYITVTLDEIIEATKMNNKKDTNSQYSKGDIDVLAMELAMQKLMGGKVKHIESDESSTFWKAFVANGDIESDETRGLDDLFNANGNLFGAGGRADLNSSSVMKILKNLYKKIQSGENVAATFAFGTFGDSDYYCTTIEGKRELLYSSNTGWIDFSGHVFTITEITENTVTFVNPHDTENKKYTVTWEEFANMHIQNIRSVTFDDVK